MANASKILKNVFSGAILILCFQITTAQSFTLEGSWRLSFKDEQSFSQPEYEDTNWGEIKELKWSDDRKTTANRTLWIRKKIIIPSSLKSEFSKTGLITLSMGKILQTDDTYLNGKKIGSTSSGDTYRNYLVTQEDILWDKENTITIRVSHWGSFSISQVPIFKAAIPENFFTYGSGVKNGDAKLPIKNRKIAYQLIITNKSPTEVEGIVEAVFYNFKGDEIHSGQNKVLLTLGQNDIIFDYASPSDFVKVIFKVSVPSYQYNHDWNAQYGYENIVYQATTPIIPYKAPQKYQPSDLAQIKIDGWLGQRLKANTEMRLHKVDEDALLAGFINRPGSHSWIGEHIGKFLEAACNAFDNNGDADLKIQIDRSAQHLIAAQLSDGYLGTYDKDSHWTSWDVWSHRYNLMGLLRYYELSGFKPSLTTCEIIGDLLIATFGNEKGQKDIVRAGGHVGMAATCILESIAELYRFTGNKKYLDFCYLIIRSFDIPRGPKILTTLDTTSRVDKVANAKAYEMMSNFLGILKLYRLTNDEKFLNPIEAAWGDIVASRLYITGTSSSFEHFQDDHILPATTKDNMGEGCVTTTWVQLNYQLFCITGEMKYLNELERSVYNHLTGSENPQTGGVSYYTPLMGKKPFRTVITCCMSSIPRGIALIPFFANGKLNNNPSFLFYQPGTYNTTIANKQISFTTTGDFLKDERINIAINVTESSPYTIDFRKPYWADNFSITVNGKNQYLATENILSIKRRWKKRDKIQISFTMPTIILEGGKSYPSQIALQRGPQVLAFDDQLNGFAADSLKVDTKAIQLQKANSSLPNKWVGEQKFQLIAKDNNSSKNIILVPYADASQTGGVVTTWIHKQ